MRRTWLLASLAILTIANAACDRENPTAPSATGDGVTINGTVTAPVPSGLQVTLGGPGTTVQVDGSGQFNFTNAPSGTLDLRFVAPGVAAAVPLPNLQANETVTLVVTISGGTVALQSARRVRGGTEELEGGVESVTPPNTFVAGGRTVSTNGGTSFTAAGQAATFNSLAAGQRIIAKGQSTGAALIATSVEILTPVVGGQSVSGVITNFTGTRSSFGFTANGTPIAGDSATTFDPGSQFIELADHITVQITGVARPGFFYATSIAITSPQDTFPGKVAQVNGGSPNVILFVQGPGANKTVMTNARTTVEQNGASVGAQAIALGQTVTVTGRTMSDGTVAASLIKIQ